MTKAEKIAAIKAEIQSNPEKYAGMDGPRVAEVLNDENSGDVEDRGVVPPGEIIAQIDFDDYSSLNPSAKGDLDTLYLSHDIDISAANVQAGLANVFSGKDNSEAALAAYKDKPCSRGKKLGLGKLPLNSAEVSEALREIGG